MRLVTDDEGVEQYQKWWSWLPIESREAIIIAPSFTKEFPGGDFTRMRMWIKTRRWPEIPNEID